MDYNNLPSMVAVRQAFRQSESIRNMVQEINDSNRSMINNVIRMNITPPKIEMNVNLDLFNEHTKRLELFNNQMTNISREWNSTIQDMLKQVSITSKILEDINIRSNIYNASVISIDSNSSQVVKESFDKRKVEMTKVSFYTDIDLNEFVFILLCVYNISILANEPTISDYFFNILGLTINTDKLLESKKDED